MSAVWMAYHASPDQEGARPSDRADVPRWVELATAEDIADTDLFPQKE
jgi:hypothetical protein